MVFKAWHEFAQESTETLSTTNDIIYFYYTTNYPYIPKGEGSRFRNKSYISLKGFEALLDDAKLFSKKSHFFQKCSKKGIFDRFR